MREPVVEVEIEVELADDNLVRRVATHDDVVVYFPTLPSAGFGLYVRAFDAQGEMKKCAWRGGASPGDRVRIDLSEADATCFPTTADAAIDAATDGGDTGDADRDNPGRGPPDSSQGRGPDKRH